MGALETQPDGYLIKPCNKIDLRTHLDKSWKPGTWKELKPAAEMVPIAEKYVSPGSSIKNSDHAFARYLKLIKIYKEIKIWCWYAKQSTMVNSEQLFSTAPASSIHEIKNILSTISHPAESLECDINKLDKESVCKKVTRIQTKISFANTDKDLAGFFDEHMMSTVISAATFITLRYAKSSTEISASNKGSFLCFQVKDDGEGFPDWMHKERNDEMVPLDSSSGQTGSGLQFSQKKWRRNIVIPNLRELLNGTISAPQIQVIDLALYFPFTCIDIKFQLFTKERYQSYQLF